MSYPSVCPVKRRRRTSSRRGVVNGGPEASTGSCTRPAVSADELPPEAPWDIQVATVRLTQVVPATTPPRPSARLPTRSHRSVGKRGRSSSRPDHSGRRGLPVADSTLGSHFRAVSSDPVAAVPAPDPCPAQSSRVVRDAALPGHSMRLPTCAPLPTSRPNVPRGMSIYCRPVVPAFRLRHQPT